MQINAPSPGLQPDNREEKSPSPQLQSSTSFGRRATTGGVPSLSAIVAGGQLGELSGRTSANTAGGAGAGGNAMPRSMSLGKLDVPSLVPPLAAPKLATPLQSPLTSRHPSVCSVASVNSVGFRQRPSLWSGMAPVHEEKNDGSDTPKASQSLGGVLNGKSLQAPGKPAPSSNLLCPEVDRRASLTSNNSIRSFNMTFGPQHSVASAASAASTVSAMNSDARARLGDMVTLFREGLFLKWLRRRWREFSLFGVTEDSTPRVWGNRVKSNTRRVSTDSNSGQSVDAAKMKKLNKMMKTHEFKDEMRLQLRDDRVDLTYLDAFETDHTLVDGCHVRVFSFGATLLEYFKIFIGMWSFFVSLTVVAFWEVIMAPDHLNQQFTLMLVDLVADFVYAACLVMQLRTTILDVSSGREYCSTKKIMKSNLSSKIFWADWMSCLPLILMSGIFKGSKIVRWITLVKASRGWRIFRTPPEHRFVPSTVFQLVQLSCSILMGGHLIACMWFMLVHEGEDTMKHHVPWHNQAYRQCLESGPTASCFWNLYTVSINQGIYLLMGIECEAYSALEHIFVSLCAPIGALVHAYMLGQIILLIQRRGALETKQNEHTMAIQEAMRILGLAPNLQMRIVTFFTYERIHRSGRLLQGLFTDLSPQLRFELQLHCYLDLVAGSGLFRKARPRVIREIVVSLVDIIFLPGDWICRYGDYGDSMYFIVNGACAIIDKDTVTQLRVLTNGAYFGEVALLTGVTRTAYVRANSFCIMAQLTKEKFRPIVEKWPEETCDVLIGAQKESDQLKIKAEATRHYAIDKRRISTASIGGAGNPALVQQVANMTLNAARHGYSDLNNLQAAPPMLNRRDSKASLQSDNSSRSGFSAPRSDSPNPLDGPSSLHPSPRDPSPRERAMRQSKEESMAVEKKSSTGSMKKQISPETEVQAFGPKLSDLSIKTLGQDKNDSDPIGERRMSESSSSSSSEIFQHLIGESESERPRAAPERSTSPRPKALSAPRKNSLEWRLSIPAEAPPKMVSPQETCELPGALSPPPEVIEEDLVIEDATKPSKGSLDERPSNLSATKEPNPATEKMHNMEKMHKIEGLSSTRDTKESYLQSNPTFSEVAAANSLLKEENDMLRKVRTKLREVAKHVSHLQIEVFGQQELLRSSLQDVRTWAAEATRDAVTQEVLKYQSELNSAVSTPDGSLPLAAPFT